MKTKKRCGILAISAVFEHIESMQSVFARPVFWVFVGLCLGLSACEPNPPAWPDEPSGAPSSAAPSGHAVPRSPPGRFFRAELDEHLLSGPAVSVLSRVDVEEVFQNGSFRGWRVMALPQDWAGLAIKPGDVVSRVNGLAIENPDDLWAVWLELAKAKDVRIAYEHEGIGRELVIPIDGAPNPKTLERLAALSEPVAPSKQPKGTVVIEEPVSPGDQDVSESGGARETLKVGGDSGSVKEGAKKKDGSRSKN